MCFLPEGGSLRSPLVSLTLPCCARQGNRILTLGEVPKDQVYGVKLKGVSVCFAMLKAVLSGNYVNFGVFRLYGDDALDNALQTFIKLLLSIPHSDLLVRCHAVCAHGASRQSGQGASAML